MSTVIITQVTYLEGYTLLCSFNNGEVKRVDMSPLLAFPAYKELSDLNEFKQFGLDETIYWANGADIAPEWLFENGVAV